MVPIPSWPTLVRNVVGEPVGWIKVVLFTVSCKVESVTFAPEEFTAPHDRRFPAPTPVREANAVVPAAELSPLAP